VTPLGCDSILGYLGLCLALLVGVVGVKSYVWGATEHAIAQTHDAEASAGQHGSQKLTIWLVERRKVLLSFGQPVDWLIGACLLAAVAGFIMGGWRLWSGPPAGIQANGRRLPRTMVVALACEMGALGGATGLGVTFLLFVA